MKRKYIFLLIALVGACYTWYFNIQFYLNVEDTSISNFLALTKTTFPSRSFSADLQIILLTFFIWYIPESLRLKIKYWWVLIPLTFIIAVAFTFPLFLYMRERKLESLEK